MVDMDTFLTTLYVLVDEYDKATPVTESPRPGPAPALSRSEALTLALFGQWGQFPSERAFYRYAGRHLRPAFPTLPARSQYNRHLRRLAPQLIALGQWVAARLLDALGQAAACAYEVVDSLGVATRHNQRRGGGWLPGQTARGYCNRLGWYVGFHVLTVVTPQGIVTGFGIAPGNSADQLLADTLLAARATPQPRLPEVGRTQAGGYYLADTGFEGDRWVRQWRTQYQAQVLIPPKRGTPRQRPVRPWPRAWRRAFAGWRQIVESAHDKLLRAFGLEHERPHTLPGFRARLAARVALYQCCCWLNCHLGRPLLAFADLLDW
jgi:hypothetical protein